MVETPDFSDGKNLMDELERKVLAFEQSIAHQLPEVGEAAG